MNSQTDVQLYENLTRATDSRELKGIYCLVAVLARARARARAHTHTHTHTHTPNDTC